MGGGDGTLRVCDVPTGREVKQLQLATAPINAATFSPDGKTLATGSPDGTVRLWDIAGGGETRTLGTQKDDIYALAFSPDGNTLASGDGRTVRLWEAASAAEVARTLATEPATRERPTTTLPHDAAGAMDRIARGRALARLNRKSEAREELTRAVAHGSNDPEVWIERGSVYAEWREWERAAADFTRAIDRSGRDGMAWCRRAMAGLGEGDAEVTRRIRDRLLTRLIVRTPVDSDALAERGRDHYRQGQWQLAAADFDRAIALGTSDWKAWYQDAIAYLGAGDLTAYRTACARSLARFGRTQHPGVAVWVARTCALAPGAAADDPRPLELVRIAMETSPKEWLALSTLALVHYRAGRYAAALRAMTEAMAPEVGGDSGANRLLLALIHHRLGHADEARRWREKGIQWRDRADLSAEDRLIYQILRREADALIGEHRRSTSGRPNRTEGMRPAASETQGTGRA
jgi:Flp pilus assembly protein TadD